MLSFVPLQHLQTLLGTSPPQRTPQGCPRVTVNAPLGSPQHFGHREELMGEAKTFTRTMVVELGAPRICTEGVGHPPTG